MKLWRISGAENDNPYEIHADSREEAMISFIDNELGLRLSQYQFKDGVQRLLEGKFCMLTTMLQVEEVLE